MKCLSSTLRFFLLLVSSAKGEENKDWCFGDYAFGIAVGVGAVAATPFVLSAAGFTAGGVAASSLAAGVQSAVYGGAVGSASTLFCSTSECWSCRYGRGCQGNHRFGCSWNGHVCQEQVVSL